ncbi:MAG: ParM/StbA family protein [Cyanobacteria bacterium J06554_11]
MKLAIERAAISTQSVTKPPSSVITYKRFAFDGGNRFIKWFDPERQPRCIPSYIKPLEDWEDAAPDPDTVIIESNGIRYAIGHLAQELKGKPTYQHSKATLAPKLFLAALEPALDRTQILIDTLVVTTPDTRDQQAVKRLTALQGLHQFQRNGIPMAVKINQVAVVDECLSAWRYAWNHGLFRYHRKNAVLDLGGGTALARVILPNGLIDRAADVKLPGTFDLANKIAAALKARSEYSPDLGLIMDAIATGSFTIGPRQSFAALFERCRQDWLADIQATLRETWVKQAAEIGEVLIVGGSANLAEALAQTSNGRFKIPDHPQLISLYGLLEE